MIKKAVGSIALASTLLANGATNEFFDIPTKLIEIEKKVAFNENYKLRQDEIQWLKAHKKLGEKAFLEIYRFNFETNVLINEYGFTETRNFFYKDLPKLSQKTEIFKLMLNNYKSEKEKKLIEDIISINLSLEYLIKTRFEEDLYELYTFLGEEGFEQLKDPYKLAKIITDTKII